MNETPTLFSFDKHKQMMTNVVYRTAYFRQQTKVYRETTPEIHCVPPY